MILRDPPDLLVLDLNMPEVDGRDVFYEARAGGFEAPILLCSAYGSRRAAKELGADAALDKPFEPDLLVEMVRELIG